MAQQNGHRDTVSMVGPIQRARRRDRTPARPQEPQAPGRSGRRPDSFYRVAVASAILHLGDRASLEFNALAQLAAVRRLAYQRYPGKIWRRGFA